MEVPAIQKGRREKDIRRYMRFTCSVECGMTIDTFGDVFSKAKMEVYMLKKSFIIIVMLLTSVSLVFGRGGQEGSGSEEEGVTLRIKSVISGIDADENDPWQDSRVAEHIREKTGVTLIQEGTRGAQWTEALSVFLAAGAEADILTFWLWDDQMAIMKQAAMDGLVADVKDLIPEHAPSLTPFLDPNNVAAYYRDTFLYAEEYADKVMFFPNGALDSEENIGLDRYGLSIRGDILEELGFDQDFRTAEELYDLLVQIRDGDFTDLNGRPVIPLTTWENAWDERIIFRNFDFGHRTGWGQLDDGTVRHWFMTDFAEDRIMFMRRLVAEGLLDKEFATQNGETITRKLQNAQVAVFAAEGHTANDRMRTILEDFPQYKFVEIGPMTNHMGTLTKYQMPLYNKAVAVLSASEVPEAALEFIDWTNSLEGKRLYKYGVEGVDYTLDENGWPVPTEAYSEARLAGGSVWTDYYNEMGNPIAAREAGVAYENRNNLEQFGELYVAYRTLFPEVYAELIDRAAYQTPEKVILDGYNVRGFEEQWGNYDQIQPVLNQIQEVSQRAYFADTEADAQRIIDDFRETLLENGYQDLEDFINEQVEGRDDVFFYLSY